MPIIVIPCIVIMSGNQAQAVVFRRRPTQLSLCKTDHVFGTARSCCYLPTGMVVTSSSMLFPFIQITTLINIETSSKTETEFGENEHFHDIAFFQKDKIVASDLHKKISVIDLSLGEVVKRYKLKNVVCGITYANNKVLFTSPNIGIVQYKINNIIYGNESVVYSDASVTDASRIAAIHDRICYSSPKFHFVTVLDSKYNVIFKYENLSLFKSPTGVAMDGHHNIYVTGYGSNNIVFISSDGKDAHQIFSRADHVHLEKPLSIAYNQERKQLAVLTDSSWLITCSTV